MDTKLFLFSVANIVASFVWIFALMFMVVMSFINQDFILSVPTFVLMIFFGWAIALAFSLGVNIALLEEVS